MKKISLLSILLLAIAFTAPALAQDEAQTQETATEVSAPSPDDVNTSKMRIGGAIYMGMATAVGDFDDEGDGAKPRFAGGGAVLFDYYLSPMLALATGIGLVGEGYKMTIDTGFGEVDGKEKIITMQIPLGVKLDLSNFQIGAALAINLGLKGKSEADDTSTDWESDQWDFHRRFNISPKITLGYAIPVGPIFIVPTADFMINLINNAKGDGNDVTERHMNIMFGAAVYYGL